MNTEYCHITILADDKGYHPFLPEHGFSAGIEAYNRKVLFDTGQTSLSYNADKARIRLSEFDTFVLSHGHYDHTGCIRDVLAVNDDIDIWAHEKVFGAHYSKKSDIIKNISVPERSRISLSLLPEKRIHRINKSVLIDENIGIVCNIP